MLAGGPYAGDALGEALHGLVVSGVVDTRETADLVRTFKSVVAEVRDKYSRFLDADETRDKTLQMRSQYAGVGVSIDPRASEKGRFVLAAVRPDGPAEYAGLRAGDRVEAVDGTPLRALEDVARIHGEPGTTVRLTVVRDGAALDFVAVRQVLPAPPHAFARLLPDDPETGYLAFTEFHTDTADVVLGLLRDLRARGAKRVILDMRFNPGGDLRAEETIARALLKKGQILHFLVMGARPARPAYAREDGEFSDLPLSVLVNEYSASASELLSAALKDHRRAVVLGENTWGKGVGQHVYPLKLREQVLTLILTTMRWLTPSRRSIHADVHGRDPGGVSPDERLPGGEAANRAAYANLQRGLHAPAEWNPSSDPWIAAAAARLRP